MISFETFLTEVAQYVATTLSTTLAPVGFVYISKLPPDPDNSVSVILQQGTISPNPLVSFSTQILVRSTTYIEGLKRSQSLFDALNNNFNLLSSIKTRTEAYSTPGNYFLDSNQRYIFPLNFLWRVVYS